jgi:murein tripeptide amidase MpaA
VYHNVDEIESAITNFATAHPTIAERISLPLGSRELNRTISCLRIGSNGATAADGALFIFGQHAREWVPPEIALNLMADLISAYVQNQTLSYGGKSYTAAQLRGEIVDFTNIFIVPCVNPDGRFWTQSGGDAAHRLWRRNRNPSVSPTPSCQGVDLNRNYDFAFDLNKYFDTAGSEVLQHTSNNPCHPVQIFHGPGAFSEPETQNIRFLVDSFPRIRWFIDVHAFKSEIYYPWGDDENQTTNPAMNWRNPAFDRKRGREGDAYGEYISHADLETHAKLAAHLRTGIRAVRGSDYFTTQIFTLYPTSGSATEWMWSRHLTDANKPRIESFAIEIAGAESDDPMFYGFQPVIAQKDEIVREVTSGLINFCLAIGPTTVPYVRELKHGTAGSMVIAAGLVPRFTGATPQLNAYVHTQSPPGGKVVRRGDTVTMNLRVGPVP